VTAAQIMTRDVVVARPEETVDEVTKRMLDKGVSGLPVVDDEGHVLGLVTESEIIRLLLPWYVELLGDVAFLPEDFEPFEELLSEAGDVRVRQIMVNEFVQATEDTTVAELATLMLTKNTRRVLILRGDKLVGTVGRRDVLQEILKH